jgi:uncharacterized damage-inducible protein DinB
MKFSAVALLLCSGAAMLSAADAPSLAQIYDRNLAGVERELVPLAEAMPADKFNFAPTGGEFKDVRTFRQQVKHIAAVNYMIAAALLAEKPPVDLGAGENGPDSVATKEQSVAFLKDSFAYLHKAMLTLTAANEAAMIKSPFGDSQTPRVSVALSAAGHCFDHYGQMVVYARMNGVVPPASR